MGQIRTKLMGGLGNQIFQLTAGLYVAEKTGRRLCLDISYYDKNKCHDGFCLPEILDLELLGARVGGKMHRFVAPITMRESAITLDRAINICKVLPNCIGVQFQGYWQIATIAEAMEKRLKKGLLPIQPQYSDCIFLHFRRGDYVIGKNKELHDVLPKDYYSEAISFVSSRYGDCPILVVSDDMEYAQSAIKQLPPADYRLVGFSDTFSTFRAMLSCRGAICANSSFSWWAAFLQANRVCWILPQMWDSIQPDLAFQRHPSGSTAFAPNFLFFE
jgi:hypothetical protein